MSIDIIALEKAAAAARPCFLRKSGFDRESKFSPALLIADSSLSSAGNFAAVSDIRQSPPLNIPLFAGHILI